MIPDEYLSKMDGHCVEIQGVELEVKVVDLVTGLYNDSLLNAYINNMKSAFKTGPRVVGVEILWGDMNKEYYSLVLCGGAANCMIVYQSARPWHKTPEVLSNFLEDSNICFVGDASWPFYFNDLFPQYPVKDFPVSRVIKAGHLASRVLRKPISPEASLEDISQKVGISYERLGCCSSSFKVDDNNPTLFTDEQVKAAVNDAYAYYRIGHKLLSSL